ncbi:MAG: insulinase family protein, partial [Coleofasciculaceae cyanobacterium]
MFNWHRYFFHLVLLGFCLSALFSNHSTGYSFPIATMRGQARTNNISSLSLAQDVSKTKLDNGLTILTKEVHTAPVVSLQVWYGVGSGNEYPGVNGISHQLEHMLFKGTTNRPVQFGRLFSSLGSISNAFTSYDKTVYYNTVQRDQLEALLVLEADRMQNVLINEEQLSTEKQVVISELEGYANSPSYNLNRQVMRTAFPQQSYGLPVGGTKTDVERLTVKQVQEYYHQYYKPDNAVLVIIGDFQTEQVLKKVEEIFGQLPKSLENGEMGRWVDGEQGKQRSTGAREDLTFRQRPPTFFTSSLVVLREPSRTALVQMLYRLPSIEHPDIPALHVLDFILREGRSSRLYEKLVASGLATRLRGYASNLKELGWYKLYVTASSSNQLGQIYRVIDETITKIQIEGITESELNRAKTQLQASLILQNRDITDLAMQLGDNEIQTGDYRYTDRYLAGIEQVSVADVRQVAIKYFNKNNRTVGLLRPTVENLGSTVNQELILETSTSTAEPLQNQKPVLPLDIANYLPSLEKTDTSLANAESDHSLCCLPRVKGGKTQVLPEKITLKNGLSILLLPDHSTPTITLIGKISAGNEFDSPSLAGLASLTANSLMSGTINKDAANLDQVLAARGASLSFASLRESVAIEGKSLARDLP